MPRFGLDFTPRSGIDLGRRGRWAKAAVDVFDRDLAARAVEQRAPARPLFGAAALPGAADAEVGKDVDRSLGIAPDEGVETIERQHVHLGGGAVEQGGDLRG